MQGLLVEPFAALVMHKLLYPYGHVVCSANHDCCALVCTRTTKQAKVASLCCLLVRPLVAQQKMPSHMFPHRTNANFMITTLKTTGRCALPRVHFQYWAAGETRRGLVWNALECDGTLCGKSVPNNHRVRASACRGHLPKVVHRSHRLDKTMVFQK